MKTKVSLKSIKNDPSAITIALPYCSANTLLRNHEPLFYNAGVYGWNCDIYRIVADNTIFYVVTGYRCTGCYRVSYDLIKEYETAAENCVNYYRSANLPAGVTIEKLIECCLKTFLIQVKREYNSR